MYIEAIQCKLSLYLKKAGLARNLTTVTTSHEELRTGWLQWSHLEGFHLLAHEGGSAKLQEGLRCFGKIFRGLSHIEKPFEGKLFETLHQLNPTSLY